jgi:hypothetical protein
MSGIVTIGQAPFSREDMLARLEEFSSLYDRRPIKNNAGGMLSPHMFLVWFVLQTLKPRAVVESGVWLGQGTWFIERACPNARLYCIDLDLDRVQYRSDRAEYFDRDFSTIDWTHLPRDETVLFFDDHQNAYERTKLAKWFGFKHLIFEDNYPALQGDCYSLKKAFAHSGLKYDPRHSNSLRLKYKHSKRKILAALGRLREIPPNDVDAKYLRQNLEVYNELPPVFKGAHTRFGAPWDEKDYPTPEPLLRSVEKEYLRRFLDEAASYTWMCYARLK